MAAGRKDWTREEHILAFNLYCKIPFGRQHSRAPEIIKLARLLGRSPNSVALKLNNFSRLDPELQARGIKGMPHGAKGEIQIWNEFEDNPDALAFESESLVAKYTGRTLEAVAEIDEAELPKEGLERDRIVRVRVNQHFFRTTVLAAYDFKCCITGLAVRELLVASHIAPWAKNKNQRMNPRNGLCLNALHDRAFDRGLMYFDDDDSVRFSDRLIRSSKSAGVNWLMQFERKRVSPPKRFAPDKALLKSHRDWCAQLSLSPSVTGNPLEASNR